MAKDLQPEPKNAEDCSQDELAWQLLGRRYISALEVTKFLGKNFSVKSWADLLLDFPSLEQLRLFQMGKGFLLPSPPTIMNVQEIIDLFQIQIPTEVTEDEELKCLMSQEMKAVGWLSFTPQTSGIGVKVPSVPECVWFSFLFKTLRDIDVPRCVHVNRHKRMVSSR